MHPLVLLTALLTSPADAGEVLVPEFTPAIQEDFTLAYMFYSLVIDELRQRDVPLVDGDALRRRAGSEAEACANSITCPSGLWSYYPSADLALVGTVGLYNAGSASESIEVRVAFFERDGYQPLKTVERTLVPGQEADFAVALAKATEVLVQRMATSSQPPPEPVAADEPDRRSGRGRSSRQEDPEPEPPKELYKSYYDVEEPDGRKTKEPKPEREPRERAVASTKAPREPRERREPSGDRGLLAAQVLLGLAAGDVGRSYDVRLSTMDAGDAELGRYEHDTFTQGIGGALVVGLMASPTPWLQAGVRLGFLSGRKLLSTGYEEWSQGERSTAELQEYTPAAALRGVIEPRVTIAPVAFGAFRPALHGFFGMRRYDGYEVGATGRIDWPDRNGGWQFVPGGGLGVTYDLGSGRGVGLEIHHAIRLGSDQVHHVQQGLITEFPDIPDPASRTTTFLVGFTQSFL